MSILEFEKQVPRAHGYSLWTAMVFIIGELAGGGVMSLTNATAHAGWTAIAMIIYCGICAAVSGVCLSKCWLILEERYPHYRYGLTRKPFAAIGYHAFGKYMSALLSILIIITRIGAGTVYILLASQQITSLTKPFVSLTLCQWIPIVALIVMIPLWLGSPGDFWPIAYTAMFSACLGTVLLVVNMAMELNRIGIAEDFHVESFESFSSSFGIVIFAFGGAVAFPNFQNDMKNKEQFSKAVVLGFIGLIILYLPTVILGYSIFGYSASSSLLDDLTPGPMLTVVKCCFVVNCAAVIFIVINPVFLDLEELFKVPKQFNWRRCLLRTCILILATFIGLTFPTFGQILDLIGGSTIAFMSFALPPIFYIKLCRDDEKEKRQIPLHLMVLFTTIVVTTVIGGVVSTYSTVKHWTPLEEACYIGGNQNATVKQFVAFIEDNL